VGRRHQVEDDDMRREVRQRGAQTARRRDRRPRSPTVNVIWDREGSKNQVKGFVSEQDNPGFLGQKIKTKRALRVGSNGLSPERLSRSRRIRRRKLTVQGHRDGSQDDAHRRGRGSDR